MRGSFLVVCFVYLTPCSFKENTVGECPLTKSSWDQNAKALKCDVTFGLFYHCILTKQGNLMEICLIPRSISTQDGCPLISVSNGHHFYFVPCPHRGLDKCPEDDQGTYSTNELYRFPGCFYLPRHSTVITNLSDSTTQPLQRGSSNLASSKNDSSNLSVSSLDAIPPELTSMTIMDATTDNKNKDVMLAFVIGASVVIGILLILVAILGHCLRLQRRKGAQMLDARASHLGDNVMVSTAETSVYNVVSDVTTRENSDSSDSYLEPYTVETRGTSNRAITKDDSPNDSTKSLNAQHISDVHVEDGELRLYENLEWGDNDVDTDRYQKLQLETTLL